MPILGPMLDERLYDPSDAPECSRWLPFNQEAAELACCLEACKQIVELEQLFVGRDSTARAYTVLATPVQSLAEHALKLHRALGRQDRSGWSKRDRDNFTDSARRLRRVVDGPIRRLRNQLSAHQDAWALHPSADVPTANADLVLPPLAHSLVVLILALNHHATFAYYRLPGPDQLQLILEYPLSTVFRLGGGGLPVEILEFRLTADPRHEASAIIRRAIDTHNGLASRARPLHPPIIASPRNPDRKRVDRTIKARVL